MRLGGPATGPERERLEAILALDPKRAARRLLGCRLVRRRGRRILTARIVETEAYLGAGDPAAHAWHGRTARTEPLWGAPGTWYVYLIYGMHHCLNVSAEPAGRPGCVLIRAAELDAGPPLAGRGPGRLTRALDVGRSLSGADAFDERSGLWLREGRPPSAIGVSTRVGIRTAAERPLRFYDLSSGAVSGARLTGGRGRA